MRSVCVAIVLVTACLNESQRGQSGGGADGAQDDQGEGGPGGEGGPEDGLPPLGVGIAGTCEQACAALEACAKFDSVAFCGDPDEQGCEGAQFDLSDSQQLCRAGCSVELAKLAGLANCEAPSAQSVRDYVQAVCHPELGSELDREAVGGGAGPDCPTAVRFEVFRAKLNELRFGGTCVKSARRADLGLLPLSTRRDADSGRTVKDLVLPGDLLAQCTLRVNEGPDSHGICNLGHEDVGLSLGAAQLTAEAGEGAGERQAVCCGVGCVQAGDVKVVEDCAAAYGEGWDCNQNRNLCEHRLEVGALGLSFEPVGDLDQARRLALVMDNSGSLLGYDGDGIPNPAQATDRTTDGRQGFRIAAARDLQGALQPDDEMAVYTYDGAGDTGVKLMTETGPCARAGEDGWVQAGDDCLVETILGLDQVVSPDGTGSPIYDAVVRAADDLRSRDAQRGAASVIVVFADGPPDGADANVSGAIAATVGDPGPTEDDIPVFVVHLDNTVVMDPPTGRFADYEALACATGGAYFHIQSADHLADAFAAHLPVRLLGRYDLRLDLSALDDRAAYPADACYAVKTHVTMALEGVERTLALQKVSSLTGGGAKFDSRIHICTE